MEEAVVAEVKVDEVYFNAGGAWTWWEEEEERTEAVDE